VILFETTAYAAGAVALIAFRVRRSRAEMYIGHARLCVCLRVCLSLAAFPHYCTNPYVTRGMVGGCPVVVHYWADLQSVHGFRCCDNIARTRNVSECLYSLYAWFPFSFTFRCLPMPCFSKRGDLKSVGALVRSNSLNIPTCGHRSKETASKDLAVARLSCGCEECNSRHRCQLAK